MDKSVARGKLCFLCRDVIHRIKSASPNLRYSLGDIPDSVFHEFEGLCESLGFPIPPLSRKHPVGRTIVLKDHEVECASVHGLGGDDPDEMVRVRRAAIVTLRRWIRHLGFKEPSEKARRAAFLSLLKKTHRRLSTAQPSDNYRLADFDDGLLDRLIRRSAMEGYPAPPIAVVENELECRVSLNIPGANHLGSVYLVRWPKGPPRELAKGVVKHPVQFYERVTVEEMLVIRQFAIVVVKSWIDYIQDPSILF